MNRSARCSSITDAAFCGMAPEATSASTSASKHSSRINMRLPAKAAPRASLLISIITVSPE